MFARTSKKLGLERTTKHIIFDNIEERKSFLKLEKYLSKTFVVISPTFDSYITDDRPFNRILVVILMKLANIAFIIRYMSSIIFSHNNYISIVLMSDANHLLGNKILISSVLCLGHFVTFMFSLVIQYFDMTSQLTVIQYLYEIKNVLIENRLNPKYSKKYYKQMNFLTKHFSWPLLSNMVLNSCLLILLPPILSYIIEPERGLSLISIILWTPISFIAIVEFNSTVLGQY